MKAYCWFCGSYQRTIDPGVVAKYYPYDEICYDCGERCKEAGPANVAAARLICLFIKKEVDLS